MAVHVDHCRRIDTRTVHHNREVAVELAVLVSDDGNSLSGAHISAHFHKVLGIVAIYGFKSVAVAYYDNVAHLRMLSREAHCSVKHRLHRIAVLGLYLHRVVLAYSGLANGQRKRVFRCLQQTEIDVEGIRTAEKSRCGNANLLLFGSSELMFYGCGCSGSHHHCSE